MRTAKRITTACLTAIMIFQALAPSTEVFAQELDAVMEASVSAARAAGNTACSVQDAVASALQDADQATSDDATTTPGADAGATEGGDGSANAGESQDSTTDGPTGGDASTEGDASQDDAAADEGTADEEQTDDADADAAAQANVRYQYSTAEELKDAGVTKITEENGTVTQIVFANEADLIKISNTNPAVYQNAVISRDANTGSEFNLDSVSVNDLKFSGFGGEGAPFKGSLDMQESTLVVSHTLYNNIELNDANRTVTVTWKGANAQPVIASKIDGNDQTLLANVTVANVSADKATLRSPLLGEVDGDLTLEASYSVGTGKTLAVDISSTTGNIGLLANTVKANASFTINKLEGLPLSGTQTVATTKDGASAGGLIGLCEDGVTVSLANPINLSNFTVVGKAASGGFIGKATKLTLGVGNKKFTCPAAVGDAKSENVGGFLGEVSFASSVAFNGNDQIDTGEGVTLAGKNDESKGVGAVIGKLNYDDLTAASSVSFVGGTFKSTYGSAGGAAVFGGLVGSVTGCIKSSPLHIEDVTAEFALEASPQFTGGLVGWLGRETGATLEVKNASVKCIKLAQSGKGFGGVAGCLDNKSIADVNGVTVKNDGEIENGAGIAAESWGSVIRLGGVTDFSGMKFAPDKSFAGKKVVSQITNVSVKNPTLVFARGTGNDNVPTDANNNDYWVYKRCREAKIDDLGSDQNAGCGYGQVIRLDGVKLRKDLIKVNMINHTLEVPSTDDWSWQVGSSDGKWSEGNRTFTIKNTQDFVCLALTVQFPNLWNGVYGFGGTDGSVLLAGVTINLTGNVDLSGTGVGGLGFDNASKPQPFTGTFNGNNHTITLAIGEPYGKRGDTPIASNDATAGNGKIYRHSRLGLFNAIGSGTAGSTVSNLTIDGVMDFDNGLAVDAGSLAATVRGNATLSGVTCKTKIACDDTFGNDVNIGGIAGSVSGAGTISFVGNTKAHATIGANGKADGNEAATLRGNTRIGGAIGYVADVAATVNVASLEIGGEITANDSAGGKKAQIGGFIGCIVQSTYKDGKIASSAEKNVNITGLSFTSFNMTVGKSGDAKNGAGGLLGYSWGNAVVTIGNDNVNEDASPYALKTTSTSIIADNSGELGGLVYAASGHWIINNYAIDLSGATVNSKSATMLGLLVGRGSKVATGVYGSESYTGLYLEDRAYWGTAYEVSGIVINAPQVKTFDEWVGNGVNPSRMLMDGEWNAVVSLHTEDVKLHMEDGSGSDNSYKNRSSFGESHKTNQYVRYYYNLDRAYNNMMRSNEDKYTSAPVHLTTPQELLLWSACRYAPADIRKYVAPEMTGESVGLNSSQVYIDDGNSSDQNTIDLSGYSYYPAEPGGNVYVQNVNIKFCYSNIKSEYANNKSNAAGTQHENMHCGLLRTMNANLTVENVTLGGTIGIAVNDGDTNSGGTVSGALVCRYIYGSSTSVKQISIDGLTLNGLTVDGVTDTTTYAPLLINEMQTYVKLDAKNISTPGYAGGTKAATSLFGKLGAGKDPDQVSAKFSLIKLPSLKSDTIFTHASLLESFGYVKTGSAVYTFVKEDQNERDKVTFGSEIDANGKNNEYVGKQLWYYDEVGYGTKENLVKVGTTVADETGESPQFGDYLPYVKRGKDDDKTNNVQYHEIKVNQRVPNLKIGCGTYGDPYAITKATELNTVAEYINTQNPSDGWEVTIAVDQETLCQRRSSNKDTNNEATYVYKQANKAWERKIEANATDPSDTLDDTTMHSYLQSAYYSIEPVDSNVNSTDTLVLDTTAFQGLGNQENPFRGVIVGNLRSDGLATIKINNSKDAGALSGLIPYSYGSVVSNLNIEYSGKAASIAHKNKDTSGVPGAFFGGVIGCIMGGDNIIDGVSVNASGDFSVAGAAAGDKGAHLVPIGGYVGAIAGGGVIFRKSSNASTALNVWHNAGTSLYDNPFVGRVIDGYAFSELAEGADGLDNTDRNYRINNLNTGDVNCIVTGETQGRYRGDDTNSLAITTTVNNSQGLLVLSAIISSGAAGGSANTTAVNDLYGTYAGSRAYLGGNTSKNTKYQFGNQNYGKVRNASYKYVGQPASAASAATDFDIAVKDDRLSPGSQDAAVGALEQNDVSKVNSPYLVSKYATWQTGNICAAQVSGMDLRFVNTVKDIDPDKGIDYDMTPYGTGYTGLSGRYYSNACASDKGADRDRIVPLVATINGDGATVRVGSKASQTAYDIKEYIDDDYKLTGVGALFGTVTYTSENVSGSIADNNDCTAQNLNFYDCNISLTYTNPTGGPGGTGDEQVGVGLLAGTTANASSLAGYGKYAGITMNSCRVNGPYNVGGLIGASGYGSRRTDKDATLLVNLNDDSKTTTRYSPVKLYDCSYSNMEISGVQNVGGFVGKLNNNSAGGVWTKASTSIAKNSTIMSTASNARTGGIVGLAGGGFLVNTDDAGTPLQGTGKAKISNITLQPCEAWLATDGTGGLIGRAENGIVSVYNLCIQGDVQNKTTFGVRGSNNLKYIAGAVGEAASGSAFKFDSCVIKDIYLGARECSAGLIGDLKGGLALEVKNSTITGLVVDGSYSGGVVGSIGSRANSVTLLNSTIGENNFTGNKNAARKPSLGSCSGGVSGDGRGSFKLVNVLMDRNIFGKQTSQGYLFGNTSSADLVNVFVAGIAIRPSAASESLGLMRDSSGTDDLKKVNQKSYVAFGDYKDAPSVPNGTLYSDDDASGNETVAVSPHVTTSPMSKIAVRVSNADTTDRFLFGDGANMGLGDGVNVGLAETIKSEAKAGKPVADRYTYTNIGGSNDSGEYQNDASDFVVGTFNGNNESKKVAKDKNFGVLVLSGGDTTTVESYLNIVTNGGYSDAKRLNSSTTKHVTANIETFTLDENNRFVRDENPTPTVSIESKDSSQMKFRASGSAWDNEKGRFNLLTVTFTEAGQSYKVQVPIIVKRMLEIDFTATFVEGSNFKSSNYNGRGADAHVLIGSGETMTGYLTWTYGQACGTPTSYGWNTYLASGGSMGPLQKKIKFLGDGTKGTLPAGTQLTLVDKANNNKEYHYTVGANGTDSVDLSDFIHAVNENLTESYTEPWLSEEVGVTASVDNTNGTWVETTEADATAKAGGKYYRPKTAEDVKAKKTLYTLSVPEESPVTENFYLVVRTPSNSASVNGYTATEIGNKGVNTRINYTLRTGDNGQDDHHNTASTYSIASNYTHNLVDKESGTKQMKMDDTTHSLDMEVSDTISFGEQEYTESDKVYYQLDSSLVNYVNGSAAGAHGYPTGTRATYSFYVTVGGKYYTWNGSGWNDPVETETPVVQAKEWSSITGGDMSLVLADTSGKAIDLSGIREKAKAHGNQFTITMRANLTMTELACQAGIITSQNNGNDKYTKPNYRAHLSTHAETLSTSSNSAYNDGRAGYYRTNVGSSTIALEASKKSQLGINIDDLKSANGEIALVGTYDFSKLTRADAMISSANKVTYTLSLQRRQDNDDGSYSYVAVDDDISKYITEYIAVLGDGSLAKGTLSDDHRSYVFTDNKTGGKFATRYENSLAFKHSFRVKVNTDVEGEGQTYANYRLVLTARMTGNGVDNTPVNVSNLADYANSDYVTYTLARINTKGIQHGPGTN